MEYVKENPSSSPCCGGVGRKKCEGFQLDPADPCNVQYYLFCEQVGSGGGGGDSRGGGGR